MSRRRFVAGMAAAAAAPSFLRSGLMGRVELEDAAASELLGWLASGRVTAHDLVTHYLARIDRLDRHGPTLRSVIELNPDALALARERDGERRAGRVRGALHGLPILLKDNIDTGDRMRTSAGSLALADSGAPRDAFLVERLRAAGAIVLGKTNLSEWANYRSTRSTSGWSARGGQTRNPHVLDRNPSGSSSGSAAAVAAALAAASVGTETDGSIISPGSRCGVVGVKPTVGLVSRRGIVPISASQDTAGPMARTVTDAALLLAAMAAADPADATSLPRPARLDTDYARALDGGALRGARLGVARAYFGGLVPAAQTVLEGAVAALRDAGAVLVDPVSIPNSAGLGGFEADVLAHEFKDGVARYLATRTDQPLRTLADLIAFNRAHADRELVWFGQELFEEAEQKGPLTSAAYREAVTMARRFARAEGLDAAFATARVEAIVAPSGGPAWPIDPLNGDRNTGGSSRPCAVAGYPAVTVPAGFVHGLPVGLTFMGPAWSERRLLALAYAFEQRTRARRAPAFRPTIAG